MDWFVLMDVAFLEWTLEHRKYECVNPLLNILYLRSYVSSNHKFLSSTDCRWSFIWAKHMSTWYFDTENDILDSGLPS